MMDKCAYLAQPTSLYRALMLRSQLDFWRSVMREVGSVSASTAPIALAPANLLNWLVRVLQSHTVNQSGFSFVIWSIVPVTFVLNTAIVYTHIHSAIPPCHPCVMYMYNTELSFVSYMYVGMFSSFTGKKCPIQCICALMLSHRLFQYQSTAK